MKKFFSLLLLAALVAVTALAAPPAIAIAATLAFTGATLSTNALTLADWAKRQDPEGRVATVAELLSQSNEILDDAVFIEGNLPTGHRVTIRTGLPTVYWRSLNQGIPNSKSTTAQVDESCGLLEARSEIDVELCKLNGNEAQFRLSEDKAFIESMNQTQASTMFYGNPGTDPRQYLGLASRYSAISGAGNSQNIIDAGGTSTNNTSIWLVGWGDETVHCMFPKGSQAGLDHKDLGEQTVYGTDPAGNATRMQAKCSLYVWKNGMVVRDWRFVVRICNINTANLVANTAAADLIALMSRSMDRIPRWGGIRSAFYMNRTVYSILRLQALNKSANAITVEKGMNQFGTPQSWSAFEGTPLRRCDQLLNTESRVV